MQVICKNCQKEFNKAPSQIRKSPNHFCSHSCAATYSNKGIQHNLPKERVCKVCQTSFFRSLHHSSIFLCPFCLPRYGQNSRRAYYQSRTLGEYKDKLSVKGKHPSWLNTHVRNFCRQWNKDLRTKGCEICGYTKHVELCHIKPITSFSNECTLGEINSPQNLRVLCPNHYWELNHNAL